MFAEARKYGLSLTLANQSLAQLTPEIQEAILANVATKLLFRAGVDDASRAERYVLPGLSARALMTLPDYHVAAHLLADGRPTPAFVFRAVRAPSFPEASRQPRAEAAAIRETSRCRHSRPVEEIERAIAVRRSAYLRNPAQPVASLGLDERLVKQLDESGLKVLGDLTQRPDAWLRAVVGDEALQQVRAALMRRGLELSIGQS